MARNGNSAAHLTFSPQILRFQTTSVRVVFVKSWHLTLTSLHGRFQPFRAHQLRGEMMKAASPPPRQAARLHPDGSGRIKPLGFSLKLPRGLELRDREVEPRQESCEHRRKGGNALPGAYLFSWSRLQIFQNASVELQVRIRRVDGERVQGC